MTRVHGWLAVVCLLASLWFASAEAARAQDATLSGVVVCADTANDDLKVRIERLERQNQELLEVVRKLQAGQNAATTVPPPPPAPAPGLPPAPPPLQPALLTAAQPVPKASPERPNAVTADEVKKIVGTYLADQDKEKKAAAERKLREGSVVGDDTKLNVSWDGGGFRYKSADEAFNVHFGGRLMTDEVWFSQSPALLNSPVPPRGSPLRNETGVGPGIGNLLDGFFARRLRVVGDGTIYQVVDYKVEMDFENYNNIAFDESYIGARNLPFVDIVRVGQTHVPFGLEAYTSSRFLPMLERSPVFDAFYQEFGPGIFVDTTFFDQHMTMQHMFHRIDNFTQFNGAAFGDGKYAYTGRVSFLPVYLDDGRYLVHFALDYQWRKGSIPLDFNGGTVLASLPSPDVTTNSDIVRFRTRQGLRDAVGLQGNNARIVDTGNIIAQHVQGFNSEFLWYWGPMWVQAEAVLSQVDNAVYPASAAGTSRGDLNFYGAYVQVGYFLTGESRGYDRRFGKYDRVRPLENFFLVRDENGKIQLGLGAWELMYRYGFVDLNDGGIQGGIYGEHTLGLNWYWNPNIKFQFNYIAGQRTGVPAGASSGCVQGFGLRGALEF